MEPPLEDEPIKWMEGVPPPTLEEFGLASKPIDWEGRCFVASALACALLMVLIWRW